MRTASLLGLQLPIKPSLEYRCADAHTARAEANSAGYAIFREYPVPYIVSNAEHLEGFDRKQYAHVIAPWLAVHCRPPDRTIAALRAALSVLARRPHLANRAFRLPLRLAALLPPAAAKKW